MAKVGRPTSYKDDYAEQARKLCLLGATDKEMADFFGVEEKTVNNWKTDHPEFLQSITYGKEIADANVADRLYERAMGYEHPDVHVSNYQGDVTLTPLTKFYPPDTQAASLWLRNRQPAKWRDKQEHEHTGKDGGPIETHGRLSDLELAQRIFGLALRGGEGKAGAGSAGGDGAVGSDDRPGQSGEPDASGPGTGKSGG